MTACVGSPWQLSLCATALVASVVCGCGASMSADARMGAELDGAYAEGDATANARGEGARGEGDEEHAQPLSATELERAKSLAEADSGAQDPPLLGARHDVQVKGTSGAVSCRCVSVLLGPATMTQLQWQGPPPTTVPETQLVIALVPDSECAGAPKGTQGSSYWGYRVSGNDVIVVLEAWRANGRKPTPPRTTTAIIPKPPAGGSVYIAPLTQDLPFGKPLEGSGVRCAIGNPGPQRNAPLSQEEQGANSAAPTEDALSD